MALLQSGCSMSCAAVAYLGGLQVKLVPLPMGTYQVDIATDNETGTFDFEVSPATEHRVQQTVMTGTNGSMLDVQLQGDVLYLQYYRGDSQYGPAQATLTVRREGVEAGHETFTPHYDSSEPNGDGCGVVAKSLAQMQLESP
jgi:DNA/RNA endonuclease YhcR with UshA esterase domain